MDRAEALRAQLESYQQHQQQLLADISRVLQDAATHGQDHHAAGASVSASDVEAQIQTLSLLGHARSYVERLKRTAEQAKQLDRQTRPAGQVQDAAQLVELASAAAEGYAACMADMEQLASCSYPAEAVPEQLRGMEEQLRHKLEAVQSCLRHALSQHIQHCLGQCGWPPPLTPSKGGDQQPGQMFGTAHADAINNLQHLMKALTRLQMATQHAAITAALQYESSGGGGSAAGFAAPEPPLLWLAEELVGPLSLQVFEVFGSNTPGSPGDLATPELVLEVVHRLAYDNSPRVDFLQGVLQGLELHSIYQVGVELTRALRNTVKQLLRQYKLPEVAAAGRQDLWLQWIDALRFFEGSLGRHGLLGIAWDINTNPDELPVALLRGSTLSVLGEDPAWTDAWLAAESGWACKQVEAVLYSPEGWQPGQLLVAEEGPAWAADAWPPRAAEEVVGLVESMLQMRLRFIPEPEAQQRYLQGAVAEVLSQAHGRITRILQQADLFKNITGQDWLFKVCPCICFCNYLEQQLQEMHDTAEILMGRILEEQQQQQEHQQHAERPPHANGNTPEASQQPWRQASANCGPPPQARPSSQQQQQQRQPHERVSDTAAFGAVVAAASTKLRVLARPISDFSSCRREWVLKLGKAVSMGFMQKAAGYVSRGALFKATSDALPAMAAGGELWSSGVVSGELQVALAWLAQLLHNLSEHLDKDCFRQAWGAAAAAINRELFNNVACEAYFSDAGALQLVIDHHALLSVFGRYTERPAPYFKELGDAVKLLNLPQHQAEFVRQSVSASTRAQNAAEVLKSVGVYFVDPDLADTVMSLRVYQ